LNYKSSSAIADADCLRSNPENDAGTPFVSLLNAWEMRRTLNLHIGARLPAKFAQGINTFLFSTIQAAMVPSPKTHWSPTT
jgi:hypothetical protein